MGSGHPPVTSYGSVPESAPCTTEAGAGVGPGHAGAGAGAGAAGTMEPAEGSFGFCPVTTSAMFFPGMTSFVTHEFGR